jgi:hypothetical protein
MTDVNTTLTNAIDEMKTIMDEMREKGKKVFYDAVSSIFETYPEVYGITWTQYTPYFNDGEECIFSISEVFFLPGIVDDLGNYETSGEIYDDLSGYDYDSIAFYMYSYQDVPVWQRPSPELKETIKSFESFTSSYEDFLKDTFGDHVEVFITREGIKVTEYEHD